MCLTIEAKEHKLSYRFFGKPVPKVAKKKLTVWKYLVKTSDKKLQAPFITDFYYEIGVQTPRVKLKPINLWGCSIINEGYHSYRNIKNCLFGCMEKNEVLVRCTIPKGTKYFVGNAGDLVSETIVVEQIRKRKN